MSGKSDKLQSHKKKTEKKSGESRKYAQIPYDSVITAAETNGITGLQEDVAKQLAEDVSYRLREIIHKCGIQMRQNKRKKLTTADVNAVFQMSDVPPIYGHVRAEEQLNLVYVKDANVFVPDEVEVKLPDMALDCTSFVQSREPAMRDSWINPDVPAETAVKSEDSKPSYNPSTVLVTYYTHIAKIVMSGSKKLLQVALKDLRTNSKIGAVFIYFINLANIGLSKLSRGSSEAFLKWRFLCMIDALTYNSFVEPNAHNAVHHVAVTVLKCVLDPVLLEGVSQKNNYELRERAAQVLAKVMTCWCGSESKLQLEVLQKLGSALLDGSGSLISHYAALKTLCALGHDALDYCLWPHLEQYLLFLDTLHAQNNINSSKLAYPPLVKDKQQSGLIEIEGALLDAAEMLYRKLWSNQPALPQNISVLERMLESHFGDSLCVRRPYYSTTPAKGVNNSTSNGLAMEVDMLISSVKKDTTSNDFELDYRNWTAIAKIPVHMPPLFLSNNRNIPTSFPDRTSNRISSAFELPTKHDCYASTIHFNFAGANPVSKRRLKRRCLDPAHVQLVCPSVYFSKSCQFSCVGKSVRKQNKVAPRLPCVDIMTVI